MRSSAVFAAVAIPALFFPACALNAKTQPSETPDIQALAAKAARADLRDRCYLYAQLVRASTEVANHDIADGDEREGLDELRVVEDYSVALEQSLMKSTKKLRDSEILLRESAFRLRSAMLGAPLAERPTMAQALAHVNNAEAKVMDILFAH